MNLKQLLFLKAAGGKGETSEPPIFFSAVGGNGKTYTKQTTNDYGTTMNTISAEGNTVTVTQVYNPEYQAKSYRNGFVCVGFDSINDWLGDDTVVTFTADIDITANPAETSSIDLFIANSSSSANITGGKITATWTNAQPSNKYYIEIRCFGCSFTLSNCKLTKVA